MSAFPGAFSRVRLLAISCLFAALLVAPVAYSQTSSTNTWYGLGNIFVLTSSITTARPLIVNGQQTTHVDRENLTQEMRVESVEGANVTFLFSAMMNGVPQYQFNESLDLGTEWPSPSSFPFYIPPSILQTTLSSLVHGFGAGLPLPIKNSTAAYSLFEGPVSTGVGEVEAWTMSVNMTNGSGECYSCDGTFQAGAGENASISFDSMTGLRVAYHVRLSGILTGLPTSGGETEGPYHFAVDQTLTSKPPDVQLAPPSGTSSSTKGGAGIPEFPYVAIALVVLSAVVVVSYLTVRLRRPSTGKNFGLGATLSQDKGRTTSSQNGIVERA